MRELRRKSEERSKEFGVLRSSEPVETAAELLGVAQDNELKYLGVNMDEYLEIGINDRFST